MAEPEKEWGQRVLGEEERGQIGKRWKESGNEGQTRYRDLRSLRE